MSSLNKYSVPDIDLRMKLAELGFECHLLLTSPFHPPAKPSVTDEPPAAEQQSAASLRLSQIKDLVTYAYDRELTEAHLQYETWVVTIRKTEAPHTVVACSTLSFTADIPSYFHTRFEAVHPEHQRTGLGRLLYECITVWTRFLILNDPIVLDGILRCKGDYCLVSSIDKDGSDENDDESDNEAGHGTFLKKLGFVRALHDFRQDTETEVAFQLSFNIPVVDWFEPDQAPAAASVAKDDASDQLLVRTLSSPLDPQHLI